MNRLLEELRRAGEAVRRNERLTAWLLLGAIALVCFALLAPPIRDRLLDRVQGAVAILDDRWTKRLERGEALVADGRYEEAVAYLERLDRNFPARHVKHGRDVERERLLRALGTANMNLGRKQASLSAFRRVVEFDPRNYLNHFVLARAALELGEPDEGLEQLERVLEIHPTYLPAVDALISYRFDGSDYGGVAEAYVAYLDAFLVYPAGLELGDAEVLVDLRVDGRYNSIDIPLGLDADARGMLRLETGPYPASVSRLELIPLRRAGVLGVDPVVLEIDDSRADRDIMDSGEAGGGLAIEIPITAGLDGLARVRALVRLRKVVSPETWAMVETSYRNLLALDLLERARERSAIVELVANAATTEGGVAPRSQEQPR